MACVAVWFGDPTTPGGPLPVCLTKAFFGIDCPGCGGLRMLYSLLHADLVAALRFNALALVGLAVLVPTFLVWTHRRLTNRLFRWPQQTWVAVVTLSLVSVWFVVRNLPFAPFTALHV